MFHQATFVELLNNNVTLWMILKKDLPMIFGC